MNACGNQGIVVVEGPYCLRRGRSFSFLQFSKLAINNNNDDDLYSVVSTEYPIALYSI